MSVLVRPETPADHAAAPRVPGTDPVAELEDGALAGRTGTVHYHPEFSKL